ncbi:type II toxin-antitoxin system prevent-host-death family antitoxin [Methylocystis iwaonis]|uniref:type II toxin-antitoxin system Phd/YefM family antitoxin n=1 Tax=Methylocystis iwaonis TaxID=2885079 RepID=UPI002E7BCF7D|nr:type II toxin-antitoxin system prevent-host-death family antitoxin [Methylocystis iwaonis]
MSSYPIAKAKEQLSRLIDEALSGETVTITRHGKPVVELRPSESCERMSRAEIESLRRRRAVRPPLGENADTLIRRIRDREE